MGQRNRYQYQGAAQAPTSSHMGHMGQGRGQGQGQGQDFQAGTSGTQGHVYDVVLQTELADQYDIQGMFPLSQECCLNLDALYSCLLLHNVRKVWA